MLGKKKNKSQSFLDRLLYGTKKVVEEKPKVVPEQVEKKEVEKVTPPEPAPESPKIQVEPEKKVELVPPKVIVETVISLPHKKEEPPVVQVQKEIPIPQKPNIEVKEVKVKLILQRDIDVDELNKKEIKVKSQRVVSTNVENEPVNFLPPLTPKVKFITREKYFSLGNGRHLGSITELRDSLEKLPEQSWRQFVTEDSNAFANWIDGAFQEYDLGTKLRSTQDRQKSVEILSSFLLRS